MSLTEAEEVVRVAARGDGVTESGRFIPFGAPGDRVQPDGQLAWGPHHQEPPCRHFPTCGGCQLQHLDDAAFGRFLCDRIAGALAAQGMEAPALRAPHISPPASRRRASLRAERRGRDVLIGFNAEGSHRIVDMRECHVLRPELFALVAPLRALLARFLPPRQRAEVQMILCDQGVDLLLSAPMPEGLEGAEALGDFARHHALARLAVDDGLGPQTLWEPEPATATFGGIAVPLPHGAFLQATAEGEAALVAAVREAIGDPAVCADLFAGIGTFALALSGRVLAVEGARDAALALKSAANRGGRSLVVDHRDLFRNPLAAADLSRFDAAVIDPPRAGAREQVAQIARSTLPLLAYVSCNPATFARDAAVLLAGGYRLDWVQPVGQFRWSTHVELAARFSRPS